MIVRSWRGWASAANADAYQQHFAGDVLGHLRQLGGFRGAELWRREEEGETEFVAVTRWDSIEAVRAFAGSDHELAVVEPEARRVLDRFDERCLHYEVAVASAGRPGARGRALTGSGGSTEAVMYYYLLLYDVVDRYVERRGAFRDAHLKLAREASERGELLLAGAMGEPVDAAALLFRTDDESVVARFAENDPYVKGGLVRTWRVRPWHVVVGGDGPAGAAS